ncbi:hypothetical protein ZWY2020_019366 [Hordeum vulgare]|nr:hypothetical protein ZWY2020_019366 [Hordeum vulgare]
MEIPYSLFLPQISFTPHSGSPRLEIAPSMEAVLSQHQGNGVGDNAMPDLEIGQSTMEVDQSTMINILHSMLPSASPPAVPQLGRALWWLGSLTLVLALTTALHLPAAGPVFAHYKAAYYTILAFVLFVAVPVELATAFFLPSHSRDGRLRVFAWYLLPCAYVVLLLVISVVTGCLTEYGEQDALCILFSECCDVLLKQRSPCLIGFPQCGFSHSTVQILPSLDAMLVNEALHQGLRCIPAGPSSRSSTLTEWYSWKLVL